MACQPNRTTPFAADLAAVAIERSRLSFAERKKREPPAIFSEPKSWMAYVHSNGVGECAARRRWTQSLTALERLERSESYREVLLAMWGVRRHHKLHNEFPESLLALVPELLATVPHDPFDRGRVKYSAEKRQVWVVGEDLKDDGGTYFENGRGFGSGGPPVQDDKVGYDPTLQMKWQRPDPLSR